MDYLFSNRIVGAIGFILSSGLLMLEVQKKWYLPALKDVGWRKSHLPHEITHD